MGNPSKNLYADLEYLGNADHYVEDILEIVEHIKLMEDFTRDEIEVLAHHMQCYAAPRDYTLLREGDEGDYLLLVLSGKVVVQKKVDALPSPQHLADVNVGSTVGEMSLVDGKPRYATCLTTMPTDFAVLTRKDLDDIFLHSPRIANKLLLVLLQLMTARLRQTCDQFMPAAFGVVV